MSLTSLLMLHLATTVSGQSFDIKKKKRESGLQKCTEMIINRDLGINLAKTLIKP